MERYTSLAWILIARSTRVSSRTNVKKETRATIGDLAVRIVRASLTTGLTALLLVFFAPRVQAGGLLFTNFDGPPDNTEGTTVNGINNLGQVAGFSTPANGAFNHFIRNVDGSFTRLNFAGSAQAMANGLNVNEQVIGHVGSTAFFLTNGENVGADLIRRAPGLRAGWRGGLPPHWSGRARP
jgi:uncharacterized membrane protein